MYSASSAYLNFIDSSNNRLPCSKIVVDGVEYSGRTHLKTYPKISHTNSKMIGGFPAATCEFEIYNTDGTVNLNGKEIKVFKGLTINGADEWIPMGFFSASDENITNNKTARSITFKGSDRACLFDKAYEQGEDITFPCTLGQFVSKLCARRGVPLESSSFPMAELTLDSAPNIPSSFTERQLISCAAELGGCIAQITREGALAIRKPFSTGRKISKIRYSAVSCEPAFGPINSIVLGREDYNDDVIYPTETPTNLCECRLEDNPFVENRREELIADIAANIIGMSFVPFKLTDCVDDYIFDINDTVEIENKDGTVFNATIISKKTTARIRSELKADTQTSGVTNRKIAGSLKNDIKRVQLDVDHLNNRITAVIENSVSRAEVELLSQELNIRFDNLENPEELENAVTTINAEGVKIKNGALTLTDNDGNTLIGVNSDENGDMYVSGKIKANSVEANSIGSDELKSNSITADKLSVGQGEFVNLLSNTTPGELSFGNGFLTHNVYLTKKANYLLAEPCVYSNLFGDDDGEFVSTTVVGEPSSSTATTGINGWTVVNGTYSNYFVSQGYYFLRVFPKTSSTSSTRCSVYHQAYLEKGKRYSLSAQINCNGWSAQNSTSIPFYFYVDGTVLTYSQQAAAGKIVSDEEMNVEFVFLYEGETGYKNVGLTFNRMTVTRINLAWVNLTIVTDRPTSFYCSKSSLLTSLSSNIINSGALIDSATDYRVYLSNLHEISDTLYVIYQKAILEQNKKYVLTARIRAEEFAKINSSSFQLFLQKSAISFEAQSISKANANDVTIRFVFKNPNNTGITNIGISWEGILKSNTSVSPVRIYWLTLWEDESETEGLFYCSDENWIKTDFRTSCTLVNSNYANDYIKTTALKVLDDNLYLNTKVRSDEGNVGCLNFSPFQVNIRSSAALFDTNIIDDAVMLAPSFATSEIAIIKPNPVSDYSDYSAKLSEFSNDSNFAKSAIYGSMITLNLNIDDGATLKSVLAPAGFYTTDEDGNVSYITAEGAKVKGVEVSSTKRIKKNIVAIEECVLEKVKSSKIYRYNFINEEDGQKLKTGFIVEAETPEEVIGDDGESINLYSMASMNWKATQELIERVEKLEKGVNKNA